MYAFEYGTIRYHDSFFCSHQCKSSCPFFHVTLPSKQASKQSPEDGAAETNVDGLLLRVVVKRSLAELATDARLLETADCLALAF